jgi:RNA polymerase sigma-70 factor (ECF subfamily)
MSASEAGATPPPPHPLETTALLIERARSGDETARNALFARYVPILSRWAHSRLPRGARDLSETADVVQVTLMRALGRLDSFQSRGEGAFLGYLRQILLNAIRDEIRRATGRKASVPLHDGLPDPAPSAIEEAVGRDVMQRYEAGLARLTPAQREVVLMRVEMGFTNAEIAGALDKPSVDAVRMLLARALVDLAEYMNE